ncbi:MAG: methanogenesis marker 3 protein [Candidatus Methanomethyliaceae archaeon]|nr:methanogenesis marker 3 protein [Candidatus Methanomethyliaceae archaeon]
MRVSIDGFQADIEPGTTVESLAKKLGIELIKDCIIAVRRPVEPEKVATNLFEISTTKGRMIIRFECEKGLDGWRRVYKRFEGTSIRWVTRDAAVFGPVLTDFEPSRDSVELKQHEITISLSGFSNENSHIVFSRKLHSSVYAPPRGCGVLGRVVYGRHLVDELRMGDRITKIEPIIETKEAEKAVVRAARSYELREPVQVYTRLGIELDTSSPIGGELTYNVISDRTLTASRKTSRFIACDRVNVISLVNERIDRRARGAVTVRNSGANAGSVYIYLREAPLTASHNIVGRLTEGIELADMSAEGDRIAVKVSPSWLDILGRTQQEVDKLLKVHGIKHIRKGDPSDQAVVVEQEPPTTLEVYRKGEVSCLGVKPSQVVKVQLFYKDAPNSVKYFKRVTGLDLKRKGKLTVYFATPKMEMILFKGDDVLAKELMPENIPIGTVEANLIGVTNAAKRYAGMIGIRFTENDEFGPSAERFEGTNIIGEVVENHDALKRLKEKGTVYLSEKLP